MPFVYVFLAAVALLIVRLLTRRRVPKGLRLPPGPPGKLIVGNLSDMPKEQEWVTFSEWAKTYGDIVYLNVFGQSILVLSSEGVTYDLFEKRSSIYSDRGEYPMVKKLMGWDWLMVFLRYGERWRRYRKVVHQKLNPAASTEYLPIQLGHTRTLLRRLHESPDQFVAHLRHTAGAIIMEMVYGIKVLPKDDPYITTAEKALTSLAIAGNPGTFLVDTIPILKYVPEWFPGAEFQKKARIWRKDAVKMSVAPFEAVKQALNSGTAEPSFTSSLLEEITIKGDASAGQEEVIRGAGSALYAGGSDTTVIALHTFFLAMLVSPEVQRKAQEELDQVVGSNRLPEFEDRENLPYIVALCKEISRWHPVIPLGVPHRVTQDDVYGDYFIPEGTIVFGNTWTLLHDEDTYGADTDKLRPERFLDPGRKEPLAGFGYGRRLCPGRHVVNNTLFITVASVLSVYDITPPRDSSGKETPVKLAFESGFLSRPVLFKCNISPRSGTAEKLVWESCP